jgi:nicotinate-nucleotide--dimethylbenzimidazole phosphoribosyltransferase
MKSFNIPPLSTELQAELQQKIDRKTKPPGALGQLEKIALKIGMIQNTCSPQLKYPHILVFAADHGIAREGVSAYPQEVTFQMILNFLNGGAAINIFCKQHNIALKIIDAGVNYSFSPELANIIDSKIAAGTKNFLYQPAMTNHETLACIEKGAAFVKEVALSGCNIIGFGEMGIGNTSSASILMSLICKIPVEECVGKGTGLSDEGIKLKIEVLRSAILNNEKMSTPLEILTTFGGFEIAQMCGAMLQAAENKMLILIDGFISTAAFLIAHALHPEIIEYATFCHQSDEQAHLKMLNYLNVKPLLNLHMRLGEGTGAAIAYPLIQSAVHFINEMASFESAGVSEKEILL